MRMEVMTGENTQALLPYRKLAGALARMRQRLDPDGDAPTGETKSIRRYIKNGNSNGGRKRVAV